MPGNLIKINPRDNVAVTFTTLVRGDVVNIKGDVITILTEVPEGHKVAVQDIKKGEKIIKYGQAAGIATEDIEKGEALHIFNMKEETRHSDPYTYDGKTAEEAAAALEEDRANYDRKSIPAISCYERKNGDVGIRNQLWLISIHPEAESKTIEMKLWADGEVAVKDGIKIWKRIEAGDEELSELVLSSLILNPNAGGIVVIGESDEHLESFRSLVKGEPGCTIAWCRADEEEKIKDAIRTLSDEMKADRRRPVPMSRLRVGLKCSSSDAFSGITANPLMGAVSDEIIAIGGASVITETPELFGAERLLLDRSESKEVFEEFVDLLERYKHHVRSAGKDPYEKLTMENRRGGITTITERSLGGLTKTGTRPVTSILELGEKSGKSGINVIAGPGTDEIAIQIEASAGCQLILYSTGDGNVPYAPIPVIAIATSAAVLERNGKTIDFNAGRMLTEDADTVTESLMTKIIMTANGEKMTINEDEA